MGSSYLAAELYGIGQLISHLKRFRVPAHQRDYSWSREQVELFITDIVEAMDGESSDYFVGLLVLLTTGEEITTWEILDGQQRLATTTILFSAIRYWLLDNKFFDDAEQIETDYLAVRKLGGISTQRMTLNVTNHDVFNHFVVERRSMSEIKQARSEYQRGTSNHLLVDAVWHCFKKIRELAEQEGTTVQQKADRLFRLASFLELNVRVVSLKLASPDDAYIVFESLNWRGNELSALDLVKNHIFSLSSEQNRPEVPIYWEKLRDYVDASNADDFLRIFWTSRFGRVQKRKLFSNIRKTFNSAELALNLAQNLADGAVIYGALEDYSSEIWYNYSLEVRDYISILTVLRSRQTRMVVFTAVSSIPNEQMEALLWGLIVLTIRYQTVGKRRTGALEIKCAEAAKGIGEKVLNSSNIILSKIFEIAPADNEFLEDFIYYTEKNPAKIIYILSELEKTYRRLHSIEYDDSLSITEAILKLQVIHLLPSIPEEDQLQDSLVTDRTTPNDLQNSIANWVLVEPELYEQVQKTDDDFQKRIALLQNSNFVLTALSAETHSRQDIEKRQHFFAELANKTWSLPNPGEGNI